MVLKKKIVVVIFIITFFVLQIQLHGIIHKKRREEGFIDRMLYKPADIISTTVLAGFKGIAADILWIRIDDYSHVGQMYKILPLFEIITYLQPHFSLAWSVGGWHMSFNLYHEAKTEKEKQKWLHAGINFLKKGVYYNPQDYRLYFDIGWIHFMKTKNYKECIKYFSLAAKSDHPQWIEHMLAHSYEKNGQYADSYRIWKGIQDRGSSEGLKNVVDKFTEETRKKMEIQLDRGKSM